MRILVANRGEIARRIMRTAHRLGHETVAVYSDPDTGSPHVTDATVAVRIGPASLAESYLAVGALLAAAEETGADAVHPGYGFLSESAEFARAIMGAGLVWIGPDPSVIATMGSKIEARRAALAADVPVIPGYDETQDPGALAAAAERVGYPVLIKAAHGGGGKGIRVVDDAAGFDGALAEAVAEGQRFFGNGDVIVERYIERPRHIEVQVVGDKHGTAIDLGTRECSVQRRYQKLLEEAPAPNLPDGTRKGLRESARALAAGIGYDSAGTVEFVVDDATGEHFFLEMNTRLQVEHPVTEEVTGLDLVELQMAVAVGDPLPVLQDEVSMSGHAIEVRINAEDPDDGFTPRTGTVGLLRIPSDVRWESAVVSGSVVSPYFDPLIAKLIVSADDRGGAMEALAEALDRLLIGGVVTNTGFHRWLLDQQAYRSASLTTRFVDETDIPASDGTRAAELAASVWAAAMDANRVTKRTPWRSLVASRLTPHRPQRFVALEDADGAIHQQPLLGENPAATVAVAGDDIVVVNLAGRSHTFRVVDRIEHWSKTGAASTIPADAVVAPFPAAVTEIHVRPGDVVAPGDVLVVIEAMKMLHSLTADGAGTVCAVHVGIGTQVETNQVLITFEDPPERTAHDAA